MVILIIEILLSQVFFSNIIVINLLTPWIIIIAAENFIWRTVTLCLIGTILLETYTIAPSGLYVCTYLSMVGLIILIKNTLMWNNFTWALLFIVAEFIVIFFENFFVFIISKHFDISVQFVSYICFRVIFTYLAGMFIILIWIPKLEKYIYT